ncbi:TrmH family RNA methyltransferase [Spirochaeta dissipatitropha]
MISVRKLQAMPLNTALRRCLRQLESLERQFPLDSLELTYLKELLAWLASVCPELGAAIDLFLGQELDQEYAFFDLRSRLQGFLGMEPAEWDLYPPAHNESSGLVMEGGNGPLAGVSLYLDGIRSPFNLGSIIRSAAAFGCRELLLSPLTVSEHHPRARRSAMGCRIALRRMDHDELLDQDRAIALLETGGTRIHDFAPLDRHLILVLGSEELGIHPGLLRAVPVRLGIPLYGSKASLNVGVAAGAALSCLEPLMRGWTSGNG